MAISCNGVDAILVCMERFVSSYPTTLVVCGTRKANSTDQAWIAQSQSTDGRRILGYHGAFSESKKILISTPGNGTEQIRSDAPHTSDTELRPLVLIYYSESQMGIAFGSPTIQQFNDGKPDQLAFHDNLSVGGQFFNGAKGLFANGDFAEPHVYNRAWTSEDIDAAFYAKTLKPEQISGHVVGWTLEDFSPDGNYLSTDGLHTLVAQGGVTASTAIHPISRTAAAGAALLATPTAISTAVSQLLTSIRLRATATGVTTATSNLTNNSFGAIALALSTSTSGLSTGIRLTATPVVVSSMSSGLTTNPLVKFLTPALKNNTGTILANETGVVVNIYNPNTGALVLRKTGLTSNAQGIVVVADALLQDGVVYSYEVVLQTNGRRLPTATATL